MGKGENIFKRKDGRWEARYEKGRNDDGRIVYGYCYGKTYREAKEKAAQKRAEVFLDPPPVQERKDSVAFVCLDWLKIKQKSVKRSTYEKYYSVINRYLIPALGTYRIRDLDPGVLDHFLQGLEETLAAKSLKDVVLILRAVLRHGGYMGMVCPDLPKVVREEQRVLTREEQRRISRFLLDSGSRQDLGILLALMTGMRIGELCALRWDQVSFRDRMIRICSTIQRVHLAEGGTEVIISSPKSESSCRVIPMTDPVAEVCQRMHPGAGFVLTGTEKYTEPRSMQYRLTRVTRECGLEGVHFHTLRHSFATRCVEVGFEIKTLSEILGHSTTGITLDRYVHASMELKMINMQKLDQLNL